MCSFCPTCYVNPFVCVIFYPFPLQFLTLIKLYYHTFFFWAKFLFKKWQRIASFNVGEFHLRKLKMLLFTGDQLKARPANTSDVPGNHLPSLIIFAMDNKEEDCIVMQGPVLKQI
jgi:hypothetical protein